MIIQVDKEKVLKEFEEKYVKGRYITEFKKILEEYTENKEEIEENLSEVFNSVCKEAILLQEKQLKGEIKYIYFSMIRTMLLENKGSWRIDLYDENWFLDKEECSINIDLNFIYEHLFYHMEELLEKKKEYGRTIKENDIQIIKQKEANAYHCFAVYVIKDLLKIFLEDLAYKEMKKKEDIVIMAGEYMDAAIKIHPQ
ncbi:hypothetical protein [Clostridium sp. C2-6-12]|uniref:hypothetical protein n=1 Tax=Clostridium sp. C2-6-12 TaxID=2698832 RepID=UPI001369F36F|nr:hypothetical protein [Clostridium sp. C2-6-12]